MLVNAYVHIPRSVGTLQFLLPAVPPGSASVARAELQRWAAARGAGGDVAHATCAVDVDARMGRRGEGREAGERSEVENKDENCCYWYSHSL